MDYLLPHHDSLTSLDPLDVCGDDPDKINEDGYVQHQYIIEALLLKYEHALETLERQSSNPADENNRKWAACFGELIQDTAYSLHNVGNLDTGFLQTILQGQPRETLGAFRKKVLRAARSLTQLLPNGHLTFLSQTKPSWTLPRGTVDALLAHLLLGTVQIPTGNEWGRPGFTALYQESPVVPSAVTGYLTTLVDHFAVGGYTSTLPASFLFTWVYSTTSADTSPQTLREATKKIAAVRPVVKPIASEPTPSADATTFVLLSAHSQPGPGPAGTHEERLMGQSPALAITSLICPKLPANVALVTSALPVHASWEGHNRYSKLTSLYLPHERVYRRYIIADAAELDVADHNGILPDLKPGVVEREIGKLEAGFGACMRMDHERQKNHGGAQIARIEVVPWGCQAFGGNLVIKAQCMMAAGGLAGVQEIHLLVTSDREDQAREIEDIASQCLTVGDLYRKLRP